MSEYGIPEWFRDEHDAKFLSYDKYVRNAKKDLNAFKAGIAQGWGERKAQAFIKSKAYLLQGMYRTGHGTYAFPEASFGGRHTADWLIASGHSAGIMWNLIELECPKSPPFIGDGNFSKNTRDGINQIQDWRNFIQSNPDLAQKSRSESGLGFFNISPQSKGIVVVGQRSKYSDERNLSHYNKRRAQSLEQNNIEIISYDTFIERLSFEINH